MPTSVGTSPLYSASTPSVRSTVRKPSAMPAGGAEGRGQVHAEVGVC